MTDSHSWRPATLLVQGGLERSHFGETAEALFLTSGFVYDDAEQAEATFKNEVKHYQYSRFGNPTVSMLEQRLALIEGAEACRATATGMAAMTAALLCQLSQMGVRKPKFTQRFNINALPFFKKPNVANTPASSSSIFIF